MINRIGFSSVNYPARQKQAAFSSAPKNREEELRLLGNFVLNLSKRTEQEARTRTFETAINAALHPLNPDKKPLLELAKQQGADTEHLKVLANTELLDNPNGFAKLFTIIGGNMGIDQKNTQFHVDNLRKLAKIVQKIKAGSK